MTAFGIYFKEIKSNFGGGKSYQKVIVLEKKQDNLIKTDSLLRSDTLTIIYENAEFVYYKDKANTKSIRKDLILGELLLK